MIAEDFSLKINVEIYKKYCELLDSNAPRSEYDVVIPNIYYSHEHVFHNAGSVLDEFIDININHLFYDYMLNKISLEELVLEYNKYNNIVMNKAKASLVLRQGSFYNNFIELGSYNQFNNNDKSIDENKNNLLRYLGLTNDDLNKTDFNVDIKPVFYQNIEYTVI